jgi:hypothetical protein
MSTQVQPVNVSVSHLHELGALGSKCQELLSSCSSAKMYHVLSVKII